MHVSIVKFSILTIQLNHAWFSDVSTYNSNQDTMVIIIFTHVQL